MAIIGRGMKRLLPVFTVVLFLIFIMPGCTQSTTQKPSATQRSPTTQTPQATQQSSPSTTHSGFVKGDVNQDGMVDMGDALMVEKMILGNIPQTKSGDVNGDGVVNMGDIVEIEQIMLGKK
jgi:hypothetical protein